MMKKMTIALLLISAGWGTGSKMDSASFDFWVGKWNLSWVYSSGDTIQGTNEIIKILNDKVIEENFAILSGPNKGFAGKSHSVFNKGTGTWKQTWVDNSGAYLDFIGKRKEDSYIFYRKIDGPTGLPQVYRMVFHDIKENSLIWDWERSYDNGETWKLLWRIHYVRNEL